MARLNGGRFVLTGTLQFKEPFLIGGVDVDAGFDASPMFNGDGNIVVPGTSLAGVLRSWVSTQVEGFDAYEVDKIFGSNDSDGGASRIRIDDIALQDSENSRIVLSTVDGVGIDRHTGAAAHGVKFDQTVVAGSPQGVLRIVCEVPYGEEPMNSAAYMVMQAIGGALQQPRLRLGRGTTKGFGLFYMENLSLVVQQANFEGLQQRLTGTGQEVTIDSSNIGSVRNNTIIHIDFDSVGAVFTKASIVGTIVDVIPRIEKKNGEASLIIPATSIRGVLRSEGERIIRTMLGESVNSNSPHFEQTQLPLVNAMYGASPQNLLDTDIITSGVDSETVGRASLSISSAFASLGPIADWENVLKIATTKKKTSETERTEIEESLVRACSQLPLAFTHHVAIDRWTGSAADKMLYTVLEPLTGEWKGLVVEFDDSRLRQQREPALALLIHSLQSLHSGAIGLGWGTTRGHGTVRISRIRIQNNETRIDISNLSDWIWDDLHTAAPSFIDEIRTAWTAWVDDLQGGPQ